MRGRIVGAVGWSVGLHLVAALALLVTPPVRRGPTSIGSEQARIEVEVREAASPVPAPRAATPPIAPSRTVRAPARPARVAPAAPSPPEARRPTSAARPAPSVEAPPADPFWTLRRPVPVAPAAPLPPAPPAPRDGFGIPYVPLPDVTRSVPPRDPVGVRQGGGGVQARVHPDGRIAFRDPPGFDLNDAVMRALGQDPYAAEKRKLAEATREDRLCLALADTEGRKRDALFRLEGQLERIAADARLSPAGRRAAVFDLWDDCEDGSDAMGAAARATVVGFVRRAFAAGTALAYTPGELAALNRRRASRQRFDPYGPPDAGADAL